MRCRSLSAFTSMAVVRSCFIGLLAFAGAAQAQVTATDPWVRGTVGGQRATGAFMQLQADEPMTLVGAQSDLTPVTEVHEMRMVDDIMRMRQVPSIALEPGEPLNLQPGGYHIMFMNLSQAVEPGQTVSIRLQFKRADGSDHELLVEAPVRPLTASMGKKGGGMNGGGHSHGGAHAHGKNKTVTRCRAGVENRRPAADC